MKWHWLMCGAGLLVVTVSLIVASIKDNDDSKTQAVPIAKANQNSQSKIAVENDFYDFGTIAMKNGLVKRVYQLTNQGDEPLLIKKVYTSCMCTKANIISQNGEVNGPFGMPGHGGAISRADVTIQPGEQFTVEAVFDPAAHGPSGIGLANRVIYLETNSTVSPKVELKFSANVINN